MLTAMQPATPEPVAPAPPAPESEQPSEDADEKPSDGIEEKVEGFVEHVEHLTEEDIKTAIRWLMGVMPAPMSEAFYQHHPKFKA